MSSPTRSDGDDAKEPAREQLDLRPCPVCGATRPRVLFRQQFVGVESALLDGYDVVTCQECGGGYADRIPAQQKFDRYYREMSKYEYHQRDGAESEFDRRRLAITASTIATQVDERHRRTVDVGCASGRLLAELRDRGFTRLVGLDPSPTCAAAAKRLYDIDVMTMTVAEAATAGASFDLIVMIGVLEHLRDLDAAMNHVTTLLAPHGLLYLEVPDATAFADWDNAPFQDFSTEHINFFSPESLNNLMGLKGLEQVLVEQNSRVQSHGTVMSNITALYRQSTDRPRGIRFETATTAGLERYIAQSTREHQVLLDKIQSIVATGQPLLVWGVGTHTSRLLATSTLAEANIVAFIESNARYQGKQLHGRPILAPEALSGRSEAVLVSSRVFQREILDQIKSMGCANDVIVLYQLDRT